MSTAFIGTDICNRKIPIAEFQYSADSLPAAPQNLPSRNTSVLTFLGKMKQLRQTCIAVLVAFLLPVILVVTMNWSDVRPYVIGDPDIANGKMLYFAATG